MCSLCHSFFFTKTICMSHTQFFCHKVAEKFTPPPPQKKPLSNDDATTFLQRDLVSLEMPNNQRFAEGMGPWHPRTHHNGWMLHEMVLKFEVDSFIGWPQKWENRDGAFMGGTRVTLAKGWMLASLTPKFWSIFEDGL